MKKINLAITGCLGRMGQQLIRSSRNNKNFKLVALTESKKISKKISGIDLELNTIKAFKAGCNIALHCNGNMSEMRIVANNSPLISRFIIKKTSQFYKILR